MKRNSRRIQLIAAFMAVFLFVLAGPCQTVMAALVPTERALSSEESIIARENIKAFLARQETRDVLISKGIDPEEAQARIDSLTDAEALMLSQQIENLPAGGNTVGIIVGALLLVFIILLITDLVGLTDVFPFTKKHR
jgi:hypothetical protein